MKRHIIKKAKELIRFVVYILLPLTGGGWVGAACSDMLEMDSDRQVFDPALDQKTDSIYYIIGTLQGVQQCVDQYVLVNELRGDLLAPTQYADSALTQLYNYTATTSNKYDSAYVYYRVINNCNYYVAHRDTTLRTGSRQVALPEYAQALAIRAWCYMQLAKTYGRVPFYTEPMDNISQGDDITANTANYQDLEGICTALAPELQKFVGTPVPYYGTINASGGKTVNSQRIMFPVDLVLADLYLETGRYAEAAQLYFTYMRDNQIVLHNRPLTFTQRSTKDATFTTDLIPTELRNYTASMISYDDYGSYSWTASFSMNPTSLANYGDVITYVPLAVNKLQGTISNLPGMFGYNQFAAANGDDLYNEDFQLGFSSEYIRLADSQPYYYRTRDDVNMCDTLGDMRRWASLSALQNSQVSNGRYSIVNKLIYANVPVYRGSVIYLRLAECLNRMGYPDAAFAVLKDGLGFMAWQVSSYPKWNYTYATDETTGAMSYDAEGNPIKTDSVRNPYAYITPETSELLTTTLPFFTQANRNVLGRAVGVHAHGCGRTMGGATLYTYTSAINGKGKELKQRYNLTMIPDSVDTDTEAGKKLAVEIVEDLICDEYALEAALEGHRFGDLLRLARNKNRGDASDKPFGDEWGSRWLSGKLAFKQTGIDFATQKDKWYLPFR